MIGSRSLTAQSMPCEEETFNCAAQVLVIDQPHGPADVLTRTISRLLDRELIVASVSDHTEALCVLSVCDVSLVMAGAQDRRLDGLAILPRIRSLYPQVPVIVVCADPSALDVRRAERYGAEEVVGLPQRAADLRRLTAYLTERYVLAG